MNWYKKMGQVKEIKKEKEEVKEYYTCPFCKETDFDLTGLKSHLERYCEIYKSIDISDW